MKHDSDNLPRFIQDLIAAGPPPAGQGVHNWLFCVARYLHHARSSDEIADLLEAVTYNCGRRIVKKEIWDAVNNSRSCAWSPNGDQINFNRPKKWPPNNTGLRGQIAANGLDLADLSESAPLRLSASDPDPVIDYLFPKNCLLCCGRTKSDFRTLPREAWRGKLAAMELIIPNPMSSKWGKTQDGRRSQHTLENTGPRRFLVVEQDKGTLDQQAAIIWHLSDYAPLALVLFSGSKSLHAWFYCHGQAEANLERFMRYAVTLGADPATWLRSQFVRIPGARRLDTGKIQAPFYFNPAVIV
jgi:hypothetical protein